MRLFVMASILGACLLCSKTALALPPDAAAAKHKHGPQTPDEVQALATKLRAAKNDERGRIILQLTDVSAGAAELKPAYKQLLDDKDKDVRIAAINVAAKMKMSETVPQIRAFLKNEPKRKISRKQSPPTLQEMEDLQYTCDAAKALIDLGDFDSVDEIISHDLFMMNSGGQFLAKFGAKVLPKVLQHANDGEMQRTGARGTIYFMRDEAAIPQLTDLLNGTDSEYAAASAKALSTILAASKSASNKSAIAAQLEKQQGNKSYQVRMGVYGGLLAADPQKYGAPIFKKLSKEDGYVQLDVVGSISQYRIKGLGPLLEQFIKDDEAKNPIIHGVRTAAARALYLTTGKKVQYKGLEEDQKDNYSNPYADK